MTKAAPDSKTPPCKRDETRGAEIENLSFSGLHPPIEGSPDSGRYSRRACIHCDPRRTHGTRHTRLHPPQAKEVAANVRIGSPRAYSTIHDTTERCSSNTTCCHKNLPGKDLCTRFLSDRRNRVSNDTVRLLGWVNLHRRAHRIIQASHPRPAPSGGASSSSGSVDPRGEQLPTSELVWLLNERLQPGAWDEDELPPEYPLAGWR